jgi:Fic family protein
MKSQLQLLTPRYLSFYQKKQPFTLSKHFGKLKQLPPSLQSFRFYVTSSAIYSSKIEGVDVDFNTYLRYQEATGVRGNKDVSQVSDLVEAYNYARTHALNLSNFGHAHALAAKQLVTKAYRGTYRNQAVYVYNYQTGERVYEGASASTVASEMDKLFADIKLLRKQDLNIDETFYYAAFIHLVLAKIHPFADGNGRSARLLEKWFLADKLGSNAWFIQSERNYQRKRRSYYRNIDIGLTYSKNDYDLCLDFLLMLPWALKLKPA